MDLDVLCFSSDVDFGEIMPFLININIQVHPKITLKLKKKIQNSINK